MCCRSQWPKAASWRAQGLDLSIAVNLSMSSISDDTLIQFVREVLDLHAGAPAIALELELTEITLMGDPDRARELLWSLGHLGVRSAIDDFGRGYSSLAYLKELPVDELKNRPIRDIATDDRDRALGRSDARTGAQPGLRAVAEGVEDALSLQLLKRLGCDSAQG